MPEIGQPLVPGGRPLRAGERVEPHQHDRNQLVYAASGVLSVTTPAGTWVAPAQRAVWIPAGIEHTHLALGPSVLRTLLFPAGFRKPGLTGAPAIIAVPPLLRELILTLVEDPPASAAERRRLEQVTLDRLHAVPDPPLLLPAPRDDRLRAVEDLLLAEPGNRYSVGEIARASGTSTRTLLRLCRRELGITVHQWRTHIRLVHALELLAKGESVSATAHRCGWANPSEFIAVFTGFVGRTPGSHQNALLTGRE
ncbi:AraC family transcriptional regulator [Amycolatopsis nigrescens]|uniref:AraC family transcriptional regulator n=1 Tax=Amycolatopsis nigrescens TaxID=381445 RepID=UPI0003733FFA|nr:helix-turn-helix transcriptional regulator [Amycolatopsis nigrescens]